jgi:hypothetical protein
LTDVVEVEGGRLVVDAVPLVLVLADGDEVDVEVDEVEVDEPVNEPLLHAASTKPARMVVAMKEVFATFVDGLIFVPIPAL